MRCMHASLSSCNVADNSAVPAALYVSLQPGANGHNSTLTMVLSISSKKKDKDDVEKVLAAMLQACNGDLCAALPTGACAAWGVTDITVEEIPKVPKGIKLTKISEGHKAAYKGHKAKAQAGQEYKKHHGGAGSYSGDDGSYSGDDGSYDGGKHGSGGKHHGGKHGGGDGSYSGGDGSYDDGSYDSGSKHGGKKGKHSGY